VAAINKKSRCTGTEFVNHILNEAEISHKTIDRLWGVLDDPELNRMLGLNQNARITLWRKKPPAF
jgi:hypothetical protein